VRLKKQLTPLCFAVLAACNSGDDSGDTQGEYINIAQNAGAVSSLAISMPEQLRTTLAIDPADIRGVVSVDGVETALVRNLTGGFTAQVDVPARSNIDINIRFYELYSGEELTLASFARNFSVGSTDAPLILRAGDYVYQIHDNDGDGASNFEERKFAYVKRQYLQRCESKSSRRTS